MQKRKQPEPFNDGIVELFDTDEDGERGDLINQYRFGYQTVGSSRFFGAQAVRVKVDELIRIPMQRELKAGIKAVIRGIEYEVKQVQHIQDSFPPKTLLSLEKKGVRDGKF